MMPKVETFKGKNFVFTPRYDHNAGRSAAFTNAQATKGFNRYEDFTVTRVNDFALFNITGEAIEAADGDEYSMVEGLQDEIDGAIENLGESLASALYRTGTGTIGQIAAGTTVAGATVLPLRNPFDIVNYYVGQTLQVSATDGGAPRTGTMTITKLNRNVDTGVASLTFGVAIDVSIAAITTNDFILNTGDSNAKIKGLGAWCPAVDPVGGDNFFGVDRSVDPVRLAGVRIAGNGAPKEETLQKALSTASIHGSKLRHGFYNPDDAFEVRIALGSRETIERTIGKARSADGFLEIGYNGIRVTGGGYTVDWYEDRWCPKGTAFITNLEPDTIHFRSLGKAPKFLSADGLKILREATDDSYEGRMGYRGNLIVKRPRDVVRITW
jgi:hypothetical protein